MRKELHKNKEIGTTRRPYFKITTLVKEITTRFKWAITMQNKHRAKQSTYICAFCKFYLLINHDIDFIKLPSY